MASVSTNVASVVDKAVLYYQVISKKGQNHPNYTTYAHKNQFNFVTSCDAQILDVLSLNA